MSRGKGADGEGHDAARPHGLLPVEASEQQVEETKELIKDGQTVLGSVETKDKSKNQLKDIKSEGMQQNAVEVKDEPISPADDVSLSNEIIRQESVVLLDYVFFLPLG
eukprot:scaffold250033_cov13-Prasinocladus_malaysianus.AAC.1